MSAHSQPSVGIDHPTVVPANFDSEAVDCAADADEPASAADDGRADR
ncbi:hypothetical protein [Halorubrum halophilum]|nr:hypothetical protein [Halorubrum halophilum]